MESIIIAVHIVIALAIIGLILLQQGKGAEAGASFGGGASQTVFGSQGGGSFFAKITAILAFLFFVTSFSLTIVAKNQSVSSLVEPGVPVVETLESDVPTLEDELPTESDIPTLDAAPVESDVPSIDVEAIESDLPSVEVPAETN